MRLQNVHRGHRLRDKAMLGLMRVMVGHAPRCGPYPPLPEGVLRASLVPLGWELPDERYYPKAGQFLLKKGYL